MEELLNLIKVSLKAKGTASEVSKPNLEKIEINIAAFKRYLIYIFLVLLFLNITVIVLMHFRAENLYGLTQFYFDREENVPTYFSTLILFIAGIILATIAILKRQIKDRFTIHWSALSIIFIILSMDEAAGFHELFIEPLRSALHLTGFLRFSWVILGIMFMIGFSLCYYRFLNSLPKLYKKGFVFSCIIYVTGAIGFEMIGGYLYSHLQPTESRIIYNIAVTIEESLEMTGAILFISVLLSYLKSMATEIKVILK